MSTPTDPQRSLPIYLGPALPRWQPRSVVDVETAISDGTMRERHWLDAKQEVGSTDDAKKKTARDLASFANDGGALLIGVSENKPMQELTVRPVELDGLAEKIDQIARSRCDPPLFVICHPLLAPEETDLRARGVLLVEIPPSPSAPHMTDGRYYGRNDTTKHQLTDGEVTRLHALRSARQQTAAQVIAAEIARDPVPAEHRERSHLFVVAQPLASPPDLLTSLIGTVTLDDLVKKVSTDVPHAGGVTPNWQGYLQERNEPRAEGSGFRSYGLVGRRFVPELEAREESVLDLEIHDSGRVTLFCGGASRQRNGEGYVLDRMIAVHTRCLVTLAGALGRVSGYGGRWLLAVGVTDLSGKYTSAVVNTLTVGRPFPPFSADDYVQGTEAVTAELLDRSGGVTSRLVTRLLRALQAINAETDRLLADAI